MNRIRRFLRIQRAAWRALFRLRAAIELPAPAPGEVTHPSQLCRCYEGQPAGAMADHRADCAWLAAMCRDCSGTGWCGTCGGDGTSAAAVPGGAP